MAAIKLSKWNLALQPLKTLYHHQPNTYGHQTRQDGDLPGKAVTHKAAWPFNYMILQERKAFYIYYHIAYGKWNWQNGNLNREAPTHTVIQPFDHLVLWDHLTN